MNKHDLINSKRLDQYFCSNHHDNRKSYQNRFQSVSGGAAAVGSMVIGAGVNDENTNDRNTAHSRDQRRSSGIDRDHRNRDGVNSKTTAEHHGSGGDFDQDRARKHKKHKKSRCVVCNISGQLSCP